jgi:hypothetical protein
MNTQPKPEHFCTLFDHTYLPFGMALHHSLMAHAMPFHLWILCMDEAVEEQLQCLNLPHVTLMPLREVETPELLAVKPDRGPGEYCWTMTPFSFEAVFDRDASVERVTYLDADLFFFDSPKILLDEFTKSQKSVLITDHAYAPEYDQSEESGRFCVQFLTFCRTEAGFHIMHWWQNKCLEWCYAIAEPDRFGDQKYLDCWPELFGDEVHICQQTEKTLAPWNIRYMAQYHRQIEPVFFHFHGARLLSPSLVRLYTKYRVGNQGNKIYQFYSQALTQALQELKQAKFTVPYRPLPGNLLWETARHTKQYLTFETRFTIV